MKKVDITGQRFNYWTALRRKGSYLRKNGGYSLWECVCDCGVVKDVSLSALRAGTSNSCGCRKSSNQKEIHSSKDFKPGDKTKFLTILSRAIDTKSKSGRVNKRFNVECYCGNTFITHKQSLIRNKDLVCSDCGRLNAAKKQNTTKTIQHWKTRQDIVCVGSYEVKVVEWLNLNQLDYKWKPKTFTLPSGKRYTPDLYISCIDSYVEVKGWWWNSKQYFDEFVNAKIGSIELWDKKKLQSMKLIK